jgi:heat shock protein HtpX
MYLRRVGLFLLTNVAVLLVLSIALKLFGLDRWLEAEIGIDYAGLLVMAAIFGFGGAFVSLAMSKWIAKTTTRMTILRDPQHPDERWLVDKVHELAQRAGIGTPEVGVYENPDPNAFATGARRDHALVAVSTGLLQSMDQDGLEAVLAHEIAHVANGDMVTMALLQGVLNTFVIFVARIVGLAVDRALFRQQRGHGPGYWIVNIAMQLVLGVVATVIVMWFSRRREYRADAGSAELVGAPSMIGALRRLELAADIPSQLPDSFRSFGIRSGPVVAALFRSHPKLEDRIAALEKGTKYELGSSQRKMGDVQRSGAH